MKRTEVSKKELLLLEKNKLQNVLSTLYTYPDIDFSLTELSAQAGVSKSSMSRFLDILEENELVNVIDRGIVFRIRAKTDSYQFIKRKIVHNLNSVYESGIVEYLDEFLNHPKAIILFGSFRSGEDRSDSDIDIAIETTENVDVGTIRPKGIDAFEALLGRKIQVLLFNRKNVDPNLFANIANGILLLGSLEVKV